MPPPSYPLLGYAESLLYDLAAALNTDEWPTAAPAGDVVGVCTVCGAANGSHTAAPGVGLTLARNETPHTAQDSRSEAAVNTQQPSLAQAASPQA